MKTTKIYVALAAAIIIAGCLYLFFSVSRGGFPEELAQCPSDALLCADGTSVSRTGPSCEFAPCPVAAKASTTTDAMVERSGVRGVVMIGPSCPDMQNPPADKCADKPYATSVVVYKIGSKKPFVLTNSDQAGHFVIPLPPGSYSLTAGVESSLPRCGSVTVTVPRGEFASTTVACDSGVR